MADNDRIPIPDDNAEPGFVAVIVARSVEQAETFRELLDDHDIPSSLGSVEDDAEIVDSDFAEGSNAITTGVPVLVPDSLLDEASEIIADREDFEERDENGEVDDDDDEQYSLDDGMTEELDPDDELSFDDEDDDDEDDGLGLFDDEDEFD